MRSSQARCPGMPKAESEAEGAVHTLPARVVQVGVIALFRQ